jgi:hypothetical protein
MKSIPFFFALLSLCGCSSTTPPTPYRVLPLDQEVVVQVGEKVGIAEDGVTELEIKKIRDDSRCPVNANCIWAGTAFVELELHKNPRLASADAPPSESFSVEYLKNATTTLTVRPRYKLSFIQLSPEKVTPNVIAQSDYRITLQITRL